MRIIRTKCFQKKFSPLVFKPTSFHFLAVGLLKRKKYSIESKY